MMDRPYILKSQEKRLQLLQQRFRQHHTDVQRLWKRIPQAPEAVGYPQSATQSPLIFDDPLSGASGGGVSFGANTGGTRRCSRGRYYYEQWRYAGRGRSLVGSRGNKSWESPDEISGPVDLVGTSCTYNTQLRDRSYLLIADRFDFAIPEDAKIEYLYAFGRWKMTRAGGAYPGGPSPFIFIREDHLGVEDSSTGYLLGPWFHRNGIKVGGVGTSGLGLGGGYSQDTWYGSEPPVGTNWSHSYTGGATLGTQLNQASPDYLNPSQFYNGQGFLTVDDVNSEGFGYSVQGKALPFHATLDITSRVYVDSIWILVGYSLFHQTGCTGESA